MHGDRKKFVLFQNKDTGQYFGALILRELPKVDFDKIGFNPSKIEKDLIHRMYIMTIDNDVNLQLEYLLPMFINEDYKEERPGMELRGFDFQDKKTFETEKTNVMLAEGKFDKLGFYRLSTSSLKKYPMPVFAFRQQMNGAVAFINDKKTGETIFAFGANLFFKEFRPDEFENIVRSLTFDKEPKALFGGI